MSKLLAVIPARSGSTRLKNKNILKFDGKPMMGRAIERAMETKIFNKIIVSTDSTKYAKLAIKFGADVPFIRDSKLSDNHTITVTVIKDAIDRLEKMNLYFDYVCCIFPCTPFLNSKLIKKYFNYLVSKKANYVYPVKNFEKPIQKAIKLNKYFKPEYLFKDKELTRTQDLDEYYYDVGQFYWGKKTSWQKEFKMHTSGLAIPTAEKLIEIDTKEDFKKANLLFKS